MIVLEMRKIVKLRRCFKAEWGESIIVVIYVYPGENGETVFVIKTGKERRADVALPL